MKQNTSRKVITAYDPEEDGLSDWKDGLWNLRSRGPVPDTEKKTHLQLQRFIFTKPTCCSLWANQQLPLLKTPAKGRGLKDILLPGSEPRALTEDQVRSLKNMLDWFHQLKGRGWKGEIPPLKMQVQPKRHRSMVFLLFSGIRREMLINLNLDQLKPNVPDKLRVARCAKLVRSINRILEQIGEWLEAE